jgi:hypothetical protein
MPDFLFVTSRCLTIDILMSWLYHMVMRTTLTLDDDIAAKLRAEVRKSGHSFRETVNRVLRLGLNAPRVPVRTRKFVVRPRPLNVKAGVNLDNVAELVERLEGPSHR